MLILSFSVLFWNVVFPLKRNLRFMSFMLLVSAGRSPKIRQEYYTKLQHVSFELADLRKRSLGLIYVSVLSSAVNGSPSTS